VKLVYLAVPFLLLATLIEWRLARRLRPGSHETLDSLGNVACGVLEQSFGKLVYPVLFLGYAWLEAHARLVRLPDGWTGVAITFVLADLAFYVFHRAAHTIPIIWATHVVHHASRRMNYTVAMRNGAFQRLFAIWFYLPLAVIGVPGEVLLPVIAVQILYQFLLHTRLGGDFGVLGLLLCAPSHHRVHHGADAAYVDRNFGGVFILWDRLFGTFATETHEPHYGVTDREMETAHPIRANLVGWIGWWRARVK